MAKKTKRIFSAAKAVKREKASTASNTQRLMEWGERLEETTKHIEKRSERLHAQPGKVRGETRVARRQTLERRIDDLANREWNIPRLRVLLEDVLRNSHSSDGFEIEHEFPQIGKKKFSFNGRRVDSGGPSGEAMLLGTKEK